MCCHATSLADAVRLTSQGISIHLTAIFYAIAKERHSVRAASWLSLNALRFCKMLDESYKLHVIDTFTFDDLKSVSVIFT